MPRLKAVHRPKSVRSAFTPPSQRWASVASVPNPISLPRPPLDLALRLLREADAELFAGHHAAAERLAHRAAALRGWEA